jgi:pimeloyl-ACP methyl ester carboxylesterase
MAVMERMSVHGAELEHAIHGSGEPVLFIHGVLIGDSFKQLLDETELADRFRLIFYHRRGFAGSDRAPTPFTIAEQAADAAALLTALGIDRAHVVGHSYGGAIALQLAADSPDAVGSLTVIEPPSMMVPSAQQFAQAAEPVIALYQSGDKQGAAESFLTGVGGPEAATLVDRVLPGARQQAIADADTFFAVEFPALADWQFAAEDAKRIDCPVQRISGSETIQWFADSDALLGDWLPHSERAPVEGSTHFVQMMRPSEVAESLAGFFARNPLP